MLARDTIPVALSAHSVRGALFHARRDFAVFARARDSRAPVSATRRQYTHDSVLGDASNGATSRFATEH